MSVIRQNELDEEQNAHVRYAVLLVHAGGPRELNMVSVLSCMAEKFSEPRLVGSIPRCVWYPILYGFVLPFSFRRFRELYSSSWVEAKRNRRPSGSVSIAHPGATPAVHYANILAQRLAENITDLINTLSGDEEAVSTPWARRGSSVSQTSVTHHGDAAPPVTYSVQVEIAYTSQHGSVDDALQRFRLHGNYTGVRDTAKRPAMVLDERLIIVPLYPQYSSLTSGTVFDAVMRSAYFRQCPCIPQLNFIRSYCDHHAYIKSVEFAIRTFIAENGVPDLLLCVFDDTPNRYSEGTDTYTAECQRTFLALHDALTGPQLASLKGSSSSAPAFTSPLTAESISMSYTNVCPPSARSPSKPSAYTLLKTVRAPQPPAVVPAVETDASSVTVSSVTAAVDEVEQSSAPADARSSSSSTVYLVFPGVAVETAECVAESRHLCEHALKCGWGAAKMIPCLNSDAAHVSMLSTIITSEM